MHCAEFIRETHDVRSLLLLLTSKGLLQHLAHDRLQIRRCVGFAVSGMDAIEKLRRALRRDALHVDVRGEVLLTIRIHKEEGGDE